jgi:hypothetical protein
VYGAGQEHWLDMHSVPPVQTVVQLPQWLLSVIRLAHVAPHRSVPFGQPELHAKLPVPVPAQTGVFPLHEVVQLPQWSDALSGVSQPPGLLEQCA